VTEPWYTKSELANLLRVSPRSVQRHVRPTMVVGGQNRYLMSDVRAQMATDLPENVTELRPQLREAA